MLSLKSGLHLSFGIFGAIAIAVGCSASGSSDGDTMRDDDRTEPQPDSGTASNSKTIQAPKNDGGKTSSSSSGAAQGDDDDDDWIGGPDYDAGPGSSSGTVPDAGVDAGPKSPEAGETCSVLDEKYTKVCGFCGKQEAICTTNRTGDLKVTEYGPCGGESGVCMQGAVEPCGSKCGIKTCGSTCGWSACKNEGVCKPGVTVFETAGCPTPGTFRAKTCADSCSFGNLSSCKAPEIIVPAPGQTVSQQWELTAAVKGKRPSSCKKTATLTTVSSHTIPLKNTGSTEVTVQIWHTSAGTSVDTAVATYGINPTNDTEYKECLAEPQDDCGQIGPTICTADGPGGWAGVDNVKIPAGGTIWIQSTGWYSYTVGKFVLNVKTK